MDNTKAGLIGAALASGVMLLGTVAAAAPARPDLLSGGQAPSVEQAQFYFGVPGVGVGVGPAPYYGGGYYAPEPYYGPGPYYGRPYYRRHGCRVRYTPYGPRRICW